MPAGFERSLKKIKILSHLDRADLAVIEAACLWRVVGAGEQFISYLDEDDDVCFVAQGSARVIIYSRSGKVVAFRSVGAGEMLGEMSAIDGRPRSASVEALGECMIARLNADTFRNVIERHPSVAMALLQHLVGQVRSLTARVYEFSTLAVNNRIHAELLRLAREGESHGSAAVIENPPTHAEIASRISTHREAVSREFSSLTHKGLLQRQGSALRITDLAILAQMVEAATGD